MLTEESSITPEVIEARGYWSEQSNADLVRLGFGRFQCPTPCLVIPLHGLEGTIIGYQVRPDRPRIKNGRPAKYEIPQGSRLLVDVPPGVRQRVLDVRSELYITEGVRKADSAAARGLCCVGLVGVWGWMHQEAFWDRVPLNGRPVYIAFDSDISVNEHVQAAAVKFGEMLRGRGAEVKWVVLRGGPTGQKQGLDDFFAAGHTLEELRGRAVGELPFPQPSAEPSGEHQGYRSTPEGLFRAVVIKGQVELEPLTNFPARITAELVVTDGVEQHSELEIEATVGEATRRKEVRAEDFQHMGWVIPMFGPRAIVHAGFVTRDHCRAAIQAVSGVVPTIPVYAHLGWVVHEGRRFFLHAGGAIGAERSPAGAEDGCPHDHRNDNPCKDLNGIGTNGTVGGVATSETPQVRAPAGFELYRLPEPPEGRGLVESVRSSLGVLGVAPDAVALPLYAAIWRALLGPVDYAIYLVGRTGVQKSELAALAQQHFGAGMDRLHLPANWTSTANSNEAGAFLAKDVLMVVDDLLLRGSRADVDRVNRDADRLLRAQGNNSGRNRCNRDGTPRGQKPPRGLIVSTGEDLPEGSSLNARLLILEVAKGAVDLDALTRCQGDARRGRYASAMAGFVRWLAPRYDRMIEEMSRQKDELRRGAQRIEWPGGLPRHDRTATTAADLLSGFEVFLEFATEIGAIDEELSETLWHRLHDCLVGLMVLQSRHQAEADPVDQLLGYLADALLSKQCHVTDQGGRAPEEYAESWGWTEVTFSVPRPGAPVEEAAAPEIQLETRRQPGGEKIGWLFPSGDLYLLTGPLLKVTQQMATRCGGHLPLTKKSLGKKLFEKGLLLSRDEQRGRYAVRRSIEGSRPEVFHLNAESIIRKPFYPKPWEDPDWEGKRFEGPGSPFDSLLEA
jgi:hypothetical protein